MGLGLSSFKSGFRLFLGTEYILAKTYEVSNRNRTLAPEFMEWELLKKGGAGGNFKTVELCLSSKIVSQNTTTSPEDVRD